MNLPLTLFVFAFSATITSFSQEISFTNARKFIFQQAGYELDKSFYVDTVAVSLPFYYLYVSEKNRVQRPLEALKELISFDKDEAAALERATTLEKKGYDVFIYKTYANSSAIINKRFMEYPLEAQVFIMFHEYMHNYIHEKQLIVKYTTNEAAGDVVGTCLSLKYFKGTSFYKNAKRQVRVNENIYKYINAYLEKKYPRQSDKERLENRIKRQLGKGNSFQKDRFDYPVNNAYLLKNQYYSKEYFRLKKLCRKHKSLIEFLDAFYRE